MWVTDPCNTRGVCVDFDHNELATTQQFVREIMADHDWQRARTLQTYKFRREEQAVKGFIAEQALATYLDAPYVMEIGHNAAQRADVDGIEVRSVGRFTDCLITTPQDKQAVYVLAVVDLDFLEVVLRGWLHLRHCRVKEYWRTDIPKPAFLTPATALHPMTTLRDEYQRRKRR